MAISDEQWDIIGTVTTVAGSLSIICSVITIVTFFKWPRFRTGVAEIVLYTAISELITIPAYAVGRHGPQAGINSLLCQWQATAEQIGDLASIFFSGCIAMDLLLLVVFHFPHTTVTKLHRRVYLPIGFSIAFLVGVAPLAITDAHGNRFYGDGNLWCWISSAFVPYRFYLFYIPLWIVFLFNIGVYITVGMLIRKRAQMTQQFKSSNNTRYKSVYVKKISLYLTAFILAWTPATVNRIYSLFFPDNPVFIFNLLHGVTTPAFGMYNFIVFMYVSWSSYSTRTGRDTSHSRLTTTDRPKCSSPMIQTHISNISKDTESTLSPSPLSATYLSPGHARDFERGTVVQTARVDVEPLP